MKGNRIGQKVSVNKIIWISVVIVWILLYAIDCYSDLRITYTHGLGLLDAVLKAAYTTFFAVAAAFLFINRPGKKERKNGTGLACGQNVNAILGVRIGILAGYFILEMLVYFLKFA